MSAELRDLEKHPEVDALVKELLAQVQTILGDQFVGLYLYGSLATGSFNPYRSDIDFVVVTNADLSDATVADLESMHMELASSGMPWATKLEGAYIPRYALRRFDPAHPPYPTINEGQFYLGRQGSDWIIQRRILRENDSAIAGPPVWDLIDPVDADDLRRSIRIGLKEWWEPMIQDPARLERPEYQPYAVLSMCRALYTLMYGELNSKDEAAKWAMDELEPQWKELTQQASEWRRDDPIGSIDRTVEFMRYTIAMSDESR
jgi:hypothetical protein